MWVMTSKIFNFKVHEWWLWYFSISKHMSDDSDIFQTSNFEVRFRNSWIILMILWIICTIIPQMLDKWSIVRVFLQFSFLSLLHIPTNWWYVDTNLACYEILHPLIRIEWMHYCTLIIPSLFTSTLPYNTMEWIGPREGFWILIVFRDFSMLYPI